MPKDDRFFDLFERHAKLLCQGARSLDAVLQGGADVRKNCEAVAAHEDAADQVTHEVMDAIRRSFITPFDRADIRELITSMDDAIDQMHKTVKVVILFEQTSFAPDMQKLGGIIVRTADLTAEAVPMLRSLRGNAKRLQQVAEEISGLEEESDQVYNTGITALYRNVGKSDAMGYIVGADIYDHLEKVVDRFEDVAKRISGVLIEHL